MDEVQPTVAASAQEASAVEKHQPQVSANTATGCCPSEDISAPQTSINDSDEDTLEPSLAPTISERKKGELQLLRGPMRLALNDLFAEKCVSCLSAWSTRPEL